MDNKEKKETFWKSLLKAVETEPLDINQIKGSTGLDYPVLACGVDKKRRRLVIVSGEADSRSATIAHADIQAIVQGMKVILVRPVATNLATLAEYIIKLSGTKKLGAKEWKWIEEHANDMKDQIGQFGEDLKNKTTDEPFINFGIASVNWSSALKNIIDQVFIIKTKMEVTRSVKDENGKIKDKFMPTFDLSPLVGYDPTKKDRELTGVNLRLCRRFTSVN